MTNIDDKITVEDMMAISALTGSFNPADNDNIDDGVGLWKVTAIIGVPLVTLYLCLHGAAHWHLMAHYNVFWGMGKWANPVPLPMEQFITLALVGVVALIVWALFTTQWMKAVLAYLWNAVIILSELAFLPFLLVFDLWKEYRDRNEVTLRGMDFITIAAVTAVLFGTGYWFISPWITVAGGVIYALIDAVVLWDLFKHKEYEEE